MDLNREQVERIRENAAQIAKHGVDDPEIITAICDLALRGLEGQCEAKDAEIAALREALNGSWRALTEVMGWIDNWGAPFTADDEWPEAEYHIKEAIRRAAAACGGKPE